MVKNMFIFDVEATSLHGTGFAVGAVVMNFDGEILDKFSLLSTESLDECNDWVKKNVLPALQDMPKTTTNLELRNRFFSFYMKYRETSDIYSDVNYPVETNFLESVYSDSQEEREWLMPYPLLDIANIVPVEIDRSKECGLDGLSVHNPLDDAIASGLCFIKRGKI